MEPVSREFPPIIIDTREQRPWRFAHAAERATLPTGDYSVRGFETRIVIERKSLGDLIGSLTAERGRFMRELTRLRQVEWRLLLIEADAWELFAAQWRSRVRPASVIGALSAIAADGIPYLPGGQPSHAAVLAERWLVKAWTRAVRAGRPEGVEEVTA
jgi:ERCC4-type nuclease